MKIPLFDIDWTLLKGKNKVHADSFSYAFEKVYKVKASKYEIESQGRPDSQIMIEILGLHGLNEEDVKKKLKEACKAAVEYFEKHKDEGQYILLPGVKEILEELKKRNFLIGVLSGNIEGIAWGKLEKAGIKKFFDFGSFGNYSHRRIDLVPIALEKAKKLKKDVKLKDLVIIGDTPRDIQCAKQTGIKVIAVATGNDSFEDLKKLGADLVINSLEEKDKILEFLNS